MFRFTFFFQLSSFYLKFDIILTKSDAKNEMVLKNEKKNGREKKKLRLFSKDLDHYIHFCFEDKIFSYTVKENIQAE